MIKDLTTDPQHIEIENLFSKPRIIGVVGNANEGKSMMLYYFLEVLSKNYKFKTYAYGLRLNFEGVQNVNSVPELEQIKDSIIIVDEMSSLFDLDNRKVKHQVENMIRLIYHNNNVLLLCGLGENFKKFISSKLHTLIYKKVLIADLINGSAVKNNLLNYKGHALGSTLLNLDKGEALIYNGKHYTMFTIPYLKKYDTKKDNKEILEAKN